MFLKILLIFAAKLNFVYLQAKMGYFMLVFEQLKLQINTT